MKKILILIILNSYLFVLNLFSQPPIQWEKCFGGCGNEVSSSIFQTSDGGFIIGGYTDSNGYNVTGFHADSANSLSDFDYWLVKIDSNGIFEWAKCYGGSLQESIQSVNQTSDGGYIMTGGTVSRDDEVFGNHNIAFNWTSDVWIVKVNDTGVIQWAKCFGGSEEDWGISIFQTNDGGYICANTASSTNGDVVGNIGGPDFWVIKLDNSGTIEWQKSYGGTSDDDLEQMIQTKDGGYIMIGYTASTDSMASDNHGNSDDFLVIKIDSIGNVQWHHCYGGYFEDFGTAITQANDGGYVLTGWTASSDGQVTGFHGVYGADYWVVKIDSIGNLIWEKCFGGSNDDEPFNITKTNDGGFVIAGYSSSVDGDVTGHHNIEGWQDYWIIKIDSVGNLLWGKCYGGSQNDYASSIIQTTDNSLIFTGRTISNDGDVTDPHCNNINSDIWVVKLAPEVGIEDIIDKNGLIVYPNPANNTIILKFNESNFNNWEFEITDVLGRTVNRQTINKPNTQVDVSGFSNGVYFYRVSNDKETQWGKFIKE